MSGHPRPRREIRRPARKDATPKKFDARLDSADRARRIRGILGLDSESDDDENRQYNANAVVAPSVARDEDEVDANDEGDAREDDVEDEDASNFSSPLQADDVRLGGEEVTASVNPLFGPVVATPTVTRPRMLQAVEETPVGFKITAFLNLFRRRVRHGLVLSLPLELAKRVSLGYRLIP